MYECAFRYECECGYVSEGVCECEMAIMSQGCESVRVWEYESVRA